MIESWTEEHERSAVRAGWNVFGTGQGPRIQRVDAPEDWPGWRAGDSREPRFAGDAEAIAHVRWCARRGSKLAKLALRLHDA